MPGIGLVTVLFNSDPVLEGFYKSLSRQSFKDYHLYIIDNTPSEKTDFLIKDLSVRFPIGPSTHIRNSENVGVAKGNNQGIVLSMEAGCTHTILLNNDIEFEQADLLGRIFSYAIEKNESFIVPKIYFYDNRKIWLAGGRFSTLKGIAYHIGVGDDDKPDYNIPKYFDYSPTCFMLIDNKVFIKIGLMDEKYFVYYDDTDFLYRATQKGYRIYYMPSLLVLHKVSSSTGGGESLFSIRYAARNRIYFIRKNLKGFTKAFALSYTLVTRGVRSISMSKEKRNTLKAAIIAGFKMK